MQYKLLGKQKKEVTYTHAHKIINKMINNT